MRRWLQKTTTDCVVRQHVKQLMQNSIFHKTHSSRPSYPHFVTQHHHDVVVSDCHSQIWTIWWSLCPSLMLSSSVVACYSFVYRAPTQSNALAHSHMPITKCLCALREREPTAHVRTLSRLTTNMKHTTAPMCVCGLAYSLTNRNAAGGGQCAAASVQINGNVRCVACCRSRRVPSTNHNNNNIDASNIDIIEVRCGVT